MDGRFRYQTFVPNCARLLGLADFEVGEGEFVEVVEAVVDGLEEFAFAAFRERAVFPLFLLHFNYKLFARVNKFFFYKIMDKEEREEVELNQFGRPKQKVIFYDLTKEMKEEALHKLAQEKSEITEEKYQQA